MKRQLLLFLLLLALVAISVISAPWLIQSPYDKAQTHFDKTYASLRQLVALAKSPDFPSRIDLGNVPHGPPLANGNRDKLAKAVSLMRRANIEMLVQYSDCRMQFCRIGFIFNVKGISVSGSAIEILYDEKPGWGDGSVHNLSFANGAPSTYWFSRYLE